MQLVTGPHKVGCPSFLLIHPRIIHVQWITVFLWCVLVSLDISFYNHRKPPEYGLCMYMRCWNISAYHIALNFHGCLISQILWTFNCSHFLRKFLTHKPQFSHFDCEIVLLHDFMSIDGHYPGAKLLNPQGTCTLQRDPSKPWWQLRAKSSRWLCASVLERTSLILVHYLHL